MLDQNSFDSKNDLKFNLESDEVKAPFISKV